MGDDIQQLFDAFIFERSASSRRRPETLRSYREVFSTFRKIAPDTNLKSLTPQRMAAFFHTLQIRRRIVGRGVEKIGVKDSTITTYRSKLNTFFEWLLARQHIEKNPLDGTPRIKPKYDDIKSLRNDQIQKIRAAVESHSLNLIQLKRDKAILYTLIACGLRKRELISLRVTDVNFERKTLTVRGENSKSTFTRVIPLNKHALLGLEDYIQERNRQRRYTTPALFVALNHDAGLTEHGLKHWVDRMRELSGVKFHLHQFRHTFAHNLAVKGVSAIQLQKLLGHTDLRMTQAYVRSLSAEDLRPVVDSLNIDDLV